MMTAWCDAIVADPGMRQQLDPLTGHFTQEDAAGYSPCALVMVDYIWRLVGIRNEGTLLHWNIRPNHPAARKAELHRRTDAGPTATISYDGPRAKLTLGGRTIAQVEGGALGLITDREGHLVSLRGIEPDRQDVSLLIPGDPLRRLSVSRNQVLKARGMS
jgi:hypothetical protein